MIKHYESIANMAAEQRISPPLLRRLGRKLWDNLLATEIARTVAFPSSLLERRASSFGARRSSANSRRSKFTEPAVWD